LFVCLAEYGRFTLCFVAVGFVDFVYFALEIG